MKNKWIGSLTFDPAKPGVLSDKVVACEFEILLDDEGGISGHYKDADYFAVTETTARITGFVDENFLSIVAHFPVKGLYDADGKFYLDADQLNHEMAFYGDLDESGDLISGNWEIVERTALDLNAINVFYTSGFFEIKKVE